MADWNSTEYLGKSYGTAQLVQTDAGSAIRARGQEFLVTQTGQGWMDQRTGLQSPDLAVLAALLLEGQDIAYLIVSGEKQFLPQTGGDLLGTGLPAIKISSTGPVWAGALREAAETLAPHAAATDQDLRDWLWVHYGPRGVREDLVSALTAVLAGDVRTLTIPVGFPGLPIGNATNEYGPVQQWWREDKDLRRIANDAGEVQALLGQGRQVCVGHTCLAEELRSWADAAREMGVRIDFIDLTRREVLVECLYRHFVQDGLVEAGVSDRALQNADNPYARNVSPAARRAVNIARREHTRIMVEAREAMAAIAG